MSRKTPKNTPCIRTDRWPLKTTPQQREDIQRTITLYRRLVQTLIGVIYTHWPTLASAKSRCAAIEKLIHRTRKNPHPRYAYFEQHFYKFPSYLRRAAIEAAIGIVSSFVSRYDQWQSGQRHHPQARPPRLNACNDLYPVMYKGQCVKMMGSTVLLKVFNGTDWVWIQAEILRKRQRHLCEKNKQLSPSLMLTRGKASLAVPFEVSPNKLTYPQKKIVSADLGIRTSAVASVLLEDGTVTARKFIQCAADIDRRDRRLKLISRKASLTHGKLCLGFGRKWYRKAAAINETIAQKVSSAIVSLAMDNQAEVIAVENLKGWRPRGGRKRSPLRQRFHGWLHRRIVTLIEEKFAEHGGQVVLVSPRGTSKYAYDGSGQVKRDKTNATQCVFSNGKQYNCDLSASYNIGARYWAHRLGRGNSAETLSGRRSRNVPRMPVTLSSLWPQQATERMEWEAATTAVLTV